jgi:transmembrane sensor
VSVLAGGFWLGAYDRAQPDTLAFQTSAGERRAFDLPDGSRITLDADSVLNVQMLPDRRSLQLARGEAYFEVAKDAARPFLVRAGGAVVRAVGTAFDVRMSVDRTVVP